MIADAMSAAGLDRLRDLLGPAFSARRVGPTILVEYRPDGELACRAELTLDLRAVATLAAVFTPPARRRQGHARHLVTALTAALPSLGVTAARLTCRPALHALYTHAGWREGEGVDEMVVQVAPHEPGDGPNSRTTEWWIGRSIATEGPSGLARQARGRGRRGHGSCRRRGR